MKTEQLIKQVVKKGSISEREVLLLKRRLNNNIISSDDLEPFWNSEIEIQPEQVEKGRNYLLNQWHTPSGKERKNNPFGFREQLVLETLVGFQFNGFYDAGNAHRSFYEPVYLAYNKEGNTFEYLMKQGKVYIIG